MAAEQYIGLMSGTSANAIDGVVVAFTADSFDILVHQSLQIDTELQHKILSFNYAGSYSLEQLCELDNQISLLASQLVSQLLQAANLTAEQVRAICFAGQTLAHNPNHGWSWQAGNPHILTEHNHIDVIADVRRRDIAAGGQGAPLAALFHQQFLRSDQEQRAIVNIGGIANLTQLYHDSPTIGFDTGPGNCLIDEWSQKHLDKPYDDNGDWAKSGTPIAELLNLMLQDSYFSQSPPKTTGRDYFNMQWLDHYLEQCSSHYAAEDIQATLVDLTVLAISLATCGELNEPNTVIYLCGGGTQNDYLYQRMKQLNRCRIFTTERLGIDPQLVEAASFAWLAHRSVHQQPGNIPSVTGAAGERILGSYYRA